MKKNINKLFLLMMLPSFMFLSSCDELGELDVNVPVEINFSSKGPNNSATESEFFCLSQYDEWREYQSDIESSRYVTGSYWTLEEYEGNQLTPNLQGQVSFTLYEGAQTVNPIITVPLGNISAASYIGNPYELELTVGQVDALNAILASMGEDGCFTAVLNVTNITGDTVGGNFVINGRVVIVLEATVRTD